MPSSVVAGTRFFIGNHTEGDPMGGMNAHAVGDEISISVKGGGSVTLSLMFLINNEKTYQTIEVGDQPYLQPTPENTTYMELNIQSIGARAEYIQMEIWQNS